LPKDAVSLAGRILAVIRKDLTSEFRSRYAVNAVVMFALVTLTVISFALGILRLSSEILAALFWIVIFFASMSGLAQTFIREEESGTSLVLKLSADGTAIFFGKAVVNLMLLFLLAVLIVPLFIILLKARINSWDLFLAGVITGLIGLAGATTIIAAIVAQASVKGTLFTVISFPVLLPLLVGVIEITKVALGGGVFDDIYAPLRLVVAYDVVMVTLSLLLFDFVWRQ